MKRAGVAARMAVTCDEPGIRFFLDRAPRGFPIGQVFIGVFLLGMGFMLLVPVGMAAMFLSDWREGTPPIPGFAQAFLAVFLLLWYFGLLSAVLRTLRGARELRQLHVDGVSNELRIVETGFLGLLGRSLKIPTSKIARLDVGIAHDAGLDVALPFERSLPGIAVRVSWWLGTGRNARPTSSVAFRVTDLDRHEEVVDIALRVGAAAGFGSYRIVRSDRREIEVAMDRHAVGEQPMPALQGADYARDQVGAEARAAAAEEKVPPFDAGAFFSRYRVRRWKPGETVILYKPFAWGVLGCLPLVALPIAMAVALAMGVGTVHVDRAFLVGAFALVGAVGVAFFVAVLYNVRPRRVSLDWTGRRIRISREEPIAMSAVRALELRGVKVYHRGGKNSPSYWMYHCEIDLHHARQGSSDVTVTRLAETEGAREDPVTPWRSALPFVTELAMALGVERRVTDYQALGNYGPRRL